MTIYFSFKKEGLVTMLCIWVCENVKNFFKILHFYVKFIHTAVMFAALEHTSI